MKRKSPNFLHRTLYYVYGISRTHFSSHRLKRGQMTGPCLVLGSAPDPVKPAGFDHTWIFMTVNASQASIKTWKTPPTASVMSDIMFEESPANVSGQQAIQNLGTRRLFLIQRGHSTRETQQRLQSLNYSFEQLTVIDHWTRSRVTYEILGSYLAISDGDRKISTGIFASLLAYYLGASPIVLSGFSLTEDGHAYNTLNHKRYHTSYDTRALSLVQKKGLPFYAADGRFSSDSALPVWKK